MSCSNAFLCSNRAKEKQRCNNLQESIVSSIKNNRSDPLAKILTSKTIRVGAHHSGRTHHAGVLLRWVNEKKRTLAHPYPSPNFLTVVHHLCTNLFLSPVSTAIIFAKKILSTRSPKYRMLCRQSNVWTC